MHKINRSKHISCRQKSIHKLANEHCDPRWDCNSDKCIPDLLNRILSFPGKVTSYHEKAWNRNDANCIHSPHTILHTIVVRIIIVTDMSQAYKENANEPHALNIYISLLILHG